MSYSAQVFRILIASPGDVNQEREIAVKSIQEWNDLNSSERQVVLLPLRWETHSAPEYGKRPQEIINRQVVDQCDLLVGIFWTRIGSPTGIADSGTLEEIERVAKNGKPVMLYFSKVSQAPDEIDIDQLKKLREFKSKTFPKALVESYSSQVEFRDKLSKQIEIQLRELLAEKRLNHEDDQEYPITDIQLHFADINTGKDAGEEISLSATYLNVVDFDEIPDYVQKSETKESKSKIEIYNLIIGSDHRNKDYYRNKIKNFVEKNIRTPIRFWLKNTGRIGSRDVYIDLTLKSTNTDLVIHSNTRDFESDNGIIVVNSRDDSFPITQIEKSFWSTYIEMRALQPKREISPDRRIFIRAQNSCEILIEANIYADTFPEPINKKLRIKYTINSVDASYKDILDELNSNK